MPANSILPDNSQRIPVVCECGKKFFANSSHSGKRFKCPSCGQSIVVPLESAGIAARPTRATSASPPKNRKGRFTGVLLWIGLWSLPVLTAIGGGVYLHFDEKWRQEARIDAANTEVIEAVKGADSWLKQGNAQDGENVEDRLISAIAAKDVSEKADADAVLETVRTRRAELAADSLFEAAEIKLNSKGVPEAVALLNRYVADRHATKIPEAKQLLTDCDLATSDSAATKTLMAMSEEQFGQFTNTGKLDDRKIAHPVLVEIRAKTLQRNLAAANQRREEEKIAQANRQKEQKEEEKEVEEAKLTEANPQESKRPALEGDPSAKDTSGVPVVWMHQAGDGAPGEMTLHPTARSTIPMVRAVGR